MAQPSTADDLDARESRLDGTDLASAAFEQLGPEHLRELLVLEQACFASPWGEKQFNLALEQKLFKVFGLALQGPEGRRLVAYLSFYHVVDEMEIFNLAVDRAFRRNGLARRLLGLVLQTGREAGIRFAFLEVRVGNEAARKLYGSFGFQQVGLRRGYYPDNGEDAIVLRLDLQQPGASVSGDDKRRTPPLGRGRTNRANEPESEEQS